MRVARGQLSGRWISIPGGAVPRYAPPGCPYQGTRNFPTRTPPWITPRSGVIHMTGRGNQVREPGEARSRSALVAVFVEPGSQVLQDSNEPNGL